MKGNGSGQRREASSGCDGVSGGGLSGPKSPSNRGRAELERAQNSGDCDRHALSQRFIESSRCTVSAIESLGAGPQSAGLVAGLTTGIGPGGQPIGSVQARAEGSTIRGQRRVEDPEGAIQTGKTDPNMDASVANERDTRRSRGRRRQRRPAEQSAEGGSEKRKRQREERPIWSQVNLVDGRLDLPALDRALEDPNISDGIRQGFDLLLRDKRLHEIYGGVIGSYESLDDKRRVYKDFTSLMVEWCDYSPDAILKLLEHYYSPLAREGGQLGDRNFHRVAPHGKTDSRGLKAGRYQRAQEGKLLGVVGSTQVREIFSGWDAVDGGVYVGDGCELFPTSIFREAYADNIAVEKAAHVLDGRPVYVEPGGFNAAAEVIDKFSISGKKTTWTWQQCQSFMRLQLDGEVTVSLVGVVLKMVLSRCPGHLGNIIRMLPACARRQFRQTPIELLPMSVPEETQAELRLHRLLLNNEQPRALTDSEKASALELAKECGREVWLGLVLAVLNAMFCGGSRPLGRVMPHPLNPTAEQLQVMDNFRALINLWIEDDQHQLKITPWEVQAQNLGDFYTGYEVTKAYKLSWAAIAPHVPGPGEAGRVALEETVPPELKDYVVNPDLLRIPDDELGDVRYSAPVLVESSAEYDLIVKHLVEAGMLEREVPSETVKVKGTPIYNGLFGVHKG